ncbi:class I SAM-dependent methyltransferase, partial [Pseudonocardia asaccharolytica]|uniref:class I SAM-dependent methyltransferase n=1 Tax=Pseudonocardia asaccharolytica TaxID=54010 RepID=UPI0021C1CCF2
MATATHSYGQGHAESVLRSQHWRSVDNSAAYLAPHLRPGMDVLDVGCGPGTITVDLARRVAPGTVVGIDASAAVLRQARANAERAGVRNVAFRQGDVLALDEGIGTFDVVHAHQVLLHLADPVAALRRMLRLTRPRAGWWPRATPTTPAPCGGPPIPGWTDGCGSTTRSPTTTAPNPTPGAACSPGRTPPAPPTSPPAHRSGAIPPPPSGPGG